MIEGGAQQNKNKPVQILIESRCTITSFRLSVIDTDSNPKLTVRQTGTLLQKVSNHQSRAASLSSSGLKAAGARPRETFHPLPPARPLGAMRAGSTLRVPYPVGGRGKGGEIRTRGNSRDSLSIIFDSPIFNHRATRSGALEFRIRPE